MAKIDMEELLRRANRAKGGPVQSALGSEMVAAESPGDLEFLVRGGIYEVRFAGFGQRSRHDGQRDPRVDIIVPGKEGYFGFLVYDRYLRSCEGDIRQLFIDQGKNAPPRYAKIIGVPRFDRSGPYIMVGSPNATSATARIEEQREIIMPGALQLELEFSPEKALSVVESSFVFYARCISKGDRGSPRLLAYDPGRNKRSGLLVPHDLDYWDNPNPTGMGQTIGSVSNQIISSLSLGDCLLVTGGGRNRRLRNQATFFNPLINFGLQHCAYYENHKMLLTRVVDYNGDRISNRDLEPTDRIHHLPVLKSEGNGSSGNDALGWVIKPQQIGIWEAPMYHLVRVRNFSGSGYVRLAEIEVVGRDGIVAVSRA